MSSSALFPDTKIPSERLADLRTISLHKLQTGSVTEHQLLLQTCIDDGFFYLDLTDPSFLSLLNDVDATFALSRDLYNYPPDIKNLFDVDTVSDLKTNGYKPKGRNVVAKDGKGDGFESWVVSWGNRSNLKQGETTLTPYFGASFHVTAFYDFPMSLSHILRWLRAIWHRSVAWFRVSAQLPTPYSALSLHLFRCPLGSALKTSKVYRDHRRIFCDY